MRKLVLLGFLLLLVILVLVLVGPFALRAWVGNRYENRINSDIAATSHIRSPSSLVQAFRPAAA